MITFIIKGREKVVALVLVTAVCRRGVQKGWAWVALAHLCGPIIEKCEQSALFGDKMWDKVASWEPKHTLSALFGTKLVLKYLLWGQNKCWGSLLVGQAR